ncbi:Anaerobic sulfatase-maturating enzyme [compost metagenome]
MRENRFLVGLSMDGPRKLHDAYRVDKAGRPTFDQVMNAAKLMRRHRVPFNILCAVHAANADRPLEVYRYFRDKVPAEFIQFIPIIERVTPETQAVADQGWGDGRPLYTQDGELVSARSVRPEQWGGFLTAVFDEWVRRDVGRVYLQLFESALAAWCVLPSPMCLFAETCGKALALEHNGDLYCCDHFVEPAFRLGNITETPMAELVASERQRAFGEAKRDTLPGVCRRCPVRFACHGECPRNRFMRSPDGEPGLNYLCAGYKAFFTHIHHPMRVMAALLARGRDPAEVKRLLRLAADTRQNDKEPGRA